MANQNGHRIVNIAAEFVRKQLDLSEEEIQRIRSYYNAQAFRVLTNSSDYIERLVQKSVLESIEAGEHVRAAVGRLKKTFSDLGLIQKHSDQLEIIFRTQMQMAYNAAKWQQNQTGIIAELLWGYKYVTVGDDRVRPEHQGLEGVTLPKETL